MKMKKSLSLLLCAALAVGTLSGCQKKDPTPPAASSTPSASTSQPAEPTPPPAQDAAIDLVVLSGPTGVGAAKLMADNDSGTTFGTYDITVVNTNDEVTAMLANPSGGADIAAIATNVASNFYNKTDGAIQLLAVNTMGVLYLLEKGDTVKSMSDLRGKTIWATGQGANPEYILKHLLTESGLDPAEDVTVEFLTPQEITAKMTTGESGICMLPVPAATALLMKDQGVRQAISLSEVWAEKISTPLPMGCVVARTQFVQENPELVAQFLKDYEASITYVSDPANLDAAAELVAKYQITDNAKIAQAAIPQCNLTFLTGDTAVYALQNYFQFLFRADPASIGGGIPYDDFFYQQP